MNITGTRNPCSCGNIIEPIYYSNGRTNGYEGIYFVKGLSYLEDLPPKNGEPEKVRNPSNVNAGGGSNANEIIVLSNKKVAIVNSVVAVPATCADSSKILSDTPTECVQQNSELLGNASSMGTINSNSICAIISEAIKSFHKSGKKLRSVETRPRPAVSYGALTASLLWAMERIFQAIRDEERSTCNDEVIDPDWYTES